MCGISGANLSSWLGSSSLGHCTMGNFCFWSSWPSPTVHLSIPMSCQQSGHLDVSALAQGLVTYSDLWLTIFSQFLHCTVQLLSYLLQFKNSTTSIFCRQILFRRGLAEPQITLHTAMWREDHLQIGSWHLNNIGKPCHVNSRFRCITSSSWFDLHWEIFVTLILQ